MKRRDELRPADRRRRPGQLSAAIRARQLAQAAGREISVCVLEKGAQVGAHILSGAVIDPVALNELLPDWRALGAPVRTEVSEDRYCCSEKRPAGGCPAPCSRR